MRFLRASLALAVILATGCGLMLDPDPASDAIDSSADAFGADGNDTGANIDASDAGDGAICNDLDMDSVTDCAGDCDDSDPWTYPGAPETCGDMITNDCTTAVADTGCAGRGTFVAPPPLGDDANMGTMTSPVATITEGMNKAMMLGVSEVYVAADTPLAAPGIYPEDIDMVEGISLIGSYESAGWTRDPSNITRIRVARIEGLHFPATITRATRLEGFEVRSGFSGTGAAATITAAVGASPTITGNKIHGPNNNLGRSHTIGINAVNAPPINSGTPLIERNVIHLGTTRASWGPDRISYGVRAGGTQMEVVNNRIFLANNVSVQFALEVYGSPGNTLIQGNVIRSRGLTEVGIGMRITPNQNAPSMLTVNNNDIDPGECQRACSGIATGGPGPAIASTPHGVRVTNNRIFGGSSAVSIGFSFGYERTSPTNVPDVIVHSNYISGTGTPTSIGRAGTSIGVFMGEHPDTHFNIGEFYNNIIKSGVGAQRFAFFESDPNIDPFLLHNNAFHLETSGTTTMSAVYADEGDRSAGLIVSFFAMYTASEINALSDLGAGGFANDSLYNLIDDCSVTSPTVGGDFHLPSSSNCIDAGSATKAPRTDFEGDARPSGPGHEIGPDETPTSMP